jgi:transglutaminase-like putative cysteine protease
MNAINVPRFALGVALAFWGWQTGHLIVGVGLGLVLEGLRWWRLRLDLGTAEHSTIADLSTIGFVLLAVILAANRGIGRGILESFVWLPVALSPIISAQLVTAEGRVPLSALFRYVRKMKREKPDTKDPPVDVSAVYFGLTLLSAGVANQRGPGYYLGVVLGAACLLYAARPRHASLAAGAVLLSMAAGIGHVAHIGLSEAQLLLVDWVMELNLIRTADPDPYRVRTEIGSLGQLKKYDAIVLRVYASEKEAARVRLLHRASYNTYVGTSWVARNTKMDPFNSEADNETWIFSPVAPSWTVKFATRFDLGRTLLALPPGTVRINAFQANALQRNAFGAVHATLPVDWAPYEAAVNPEFPGYAAPGEDDLAVPQAERAALERVVAELGLRGMASAAAAKRIEQHFASFRYSTYRARPVPRDATALGDFLTRTRSGHCEYFAAATALLLRAAGIPARYATGFAVMEYSGLERAYVVRTRHAHAWTRAWLDGRWTDLDTTPAAWFAEEEAEAPLWQGLADLLRYAGFRWSQRGEFEAGDSWYAVLALLAVVLAWSVLRNRRVVREKQAAVAARVRYPGEDSEFYALEKSLPPRDPGEPQAAWLSRIAKGLSVQQLESARAALRLHQRYRFDPQGLAIAERDSLRELCRSLATPTR